MPSRHRAAVTIVDLGGGRVSGATAPRRVKSSSCTRFLHHTKRRTTVGRTPLDEWSTLRTQPCLRGIRIRDLSTRAAADPRFRPRGHRDRQATSVLGGFGGQRWTSTGFHQRIYRGIRCTGGCTGPCVRFTKIRKFSPLYRISNHGPFSMYGVPIPTEVSGTSGV